MQIFEKREFKGIRDDLLLPWSFHKAPHILEDMEFHRCTFTRCILSLTHDVHRRTVVRRTNLFNCKEVGCKLYSAIIEDALIDGLSTGHLHSWGTVFQHVTLRGHIGPIMLSNKVFPTQPTAKVDQAFASANAAYYANVDWALDIREAEFEDDVDLRGVPGHLIRRDPETQVLVTRTKALEGKWRSLDLEKTYWTTALEIFLKDGTLDSIVLASPRRIRRSPSNPWTVQDLVDGLRLLRDKGIAEPD